MACKTAGLSALVLEGNSGEGKTGTIRDILLKKGYQELDCYSDALPQQDKFFYSLPVTLSLARKKELLLKAFDLGGCVIINNIAACSQLESLINDLFMGVGPGNRPAQKGGFFAFATNPTQSQTIFTLSNAVRRRIINCTITPYSAEELIMILIQRGLKPATAKYYVHQFELAKKEALDKDLKPQPTLDTFWRVIDKVLTEQKNNLCFVGSDFIRMHTRGKHSLEENEQPQSKRRRHSDDAALGRMP